MRVGTHTQESPGPPGNMRVGTHNTTTTILIPTRIRIGNPKKKNEKKNYVYIGSQK